ncbi:MAG: hypothetical protein MJ101_00945, partial [Clostridia bacterium]|nr:hypothetical protein [Clostridia bacterium]
MKKIVSFMLAMLMVFSTFTILPITVVAGSPDDAYDVENGNFRWKDIHVTTDIYGKIDGFSAKAICNDPQYWRNVTSRNYGFAIIEANDDIFPTTDSTPGGRFSASNSDVSDLKSRCVWQEVNVGRPDDPVWITLDVNTKDDLAKLDVDKDYYLYLWVGSGSCTFESCAGKLTHITINRFVDEGSGYQLRKTERTMGIAGQVLNGVTKKFGTYTFNIRLSDDAKKACATDNVYNLYYDSSEQFRLGLYDSESKAFISASGSGTAKFKSMMIAYGNALESGEEMALPTVDGFAKSDTASTNYSVVINMSEGKTLAEIAEYVKRIVFKNSPIGQTIQISISSDTVEEKTFFNAANGHYYQYVAYPDNGSHHWIDAYNTAKSMTFAGRTGYLATVKDFDEDLFIYKASDSVGFLGGTVLNHGDEDGALYYTYTVDDHGTYDRATMKTWYWACGPERGEVFYGDYNGAFNSNDAYGYNKGQGYYFNWRENEPNGSDVSNGGNECCLTTLTVGPGYAAIAAGVEIPSSWNDMPECAASNLPSAQKYAVKGYFVEYGDLPYGDSGFLTENKPSVSVSGRIGTAKAITNGTPEELKDDNHGYIVVDKALANKDDIITVTVHPEKNFELDKLTYVCSGDKVVTPIRDNAGTYSFEMPDKPVTVVATFKSHRHGEGAAEVTFKEWDKDDSLPTTAGNYYLVDDVGLSDTWVVPTDGDVNICLNGHSIIMMENVTDVINVPAGATLRIYDCDPTEQEIIAGVHGIGGAIRLTGSGVKAKGINVSGSFTMNGGTVCSMTCGVYINGGSFTMNGGVIAGNKDASETNDIFGAGVYMNGGTFVMNGGFIRENILQNEGGYSAYGAGVCVDGDGVFTMNGGRVSNNVMYMDSAYGGGICVKDGSFVMSNGEICDNESRYGAGLYVGADGTASVKGGKISGNTASVFGGGIYDAGALTLGGTVKVVDNANDNLYTERNKLISVDSPADGMYVGVSTETSGGNFSDNNVEHGYEKYFFSDDPLKWVDISDHLWLKSVGGESYKVTVNPCDHGAVYSDCQMVLKSVADHTTIHITVVPDAGYRLKTLTYNDGTDHDITADAQGNYTFTMPDSDVTVTATFVSHFHGEGDDIIVFESWDGGAEHNSMPTEAGNYYLTDDIILFDTWEVPTGVTNLCLNGHIVEMVKDGRVITVKTGATLNLHDCDTTTEHYFTKNESGLWIIAADQTVITDYYVIGGAVTGGYADRGGSEDVIKGVGGGVCVCKEASFTMTGGNIVGNKTTSNQSGCGGGGVFIDNSGSFTMSGGNIVGNSCGTGGGVCVYNGASFTMTGGTITDGAANNGGGVYVSGTFTMTGDSIISGHNCT